MSLISDICMKWTNYTSIIYIQELALCPLVTYWLGGRLTKIDTANDNLEHLKNSMKYEIDIVTMNSMIDFSEDYVPEEF